MAARFAVSIALVVVALLLVFFKRDVPEPSSENAQYDFDIAVQSIDKQVDAVLASYGVEPSCIKRKEFADPEKRFVRVERRVLIPPTVVPVTLNKDLNRLARQHRGRAVAVENLRENSVTIHILIQENVVQTVILKVYQDNRKKEQREQSRKV